MNVGLMIYGRLDTLTGGYIYDRQMVTALERRGHRVSVVSLPLRSYPGRLALNIQPQRLAKSLLDDLELLIQDELCHPSLVRLNGRRRGRRCPVVTVVHQVLCDEPRAPWQNRLLRLLEKRYLDGVDGFVFNSRTTQDTVWGLTAADRPHLVAPPGGDRIGPRPALDMATARALQPGPLRLLFLGNLIPRKGLLPLLVALEGLPDDAWDLRVVGRLDMDQDHVQLVRRRLQTCRMADRVRLLGRREGFLLVDELVRAQVLCMPYAYEGFGMASLEAQGFGLPVIGGREGATGELVDHGVNGFLVKRADHAAVQGAITSLHADRQKLREMSIAARRRFDGHPTWGHSMARLVSFLEDLVAS